MKCKRTVCNSDNAICWHTQSGDMYCPACAHGINRHNPGLVLFPVRFPVRADDGGSLMTIAAFNQGVIAGAFPFDKGWARWSTSTHQGALIEDFDGLAPTWATHVVWFKRV